MEGALRLKAKVEQRLRDHRLRPTKARIRVGMLLLESPKHLSAAQVYLGSPKHLSANQKCLSADRTHISANQIFDWLTEHGHCISKATVYNTLNVFAKHGVVNEVAVDPTRMYYDSTTSPHHHFYNTDTGQLTDIPRENISVENIPRLPDNTEIEDLEIVIKIKNKQPS